MNDSLKLDMFFPDELLSITSVDHDDSSIHIKMRSKTHSSKCPECGQETKTYHGTYLRKVQDLPILGKTARLHITAHEYVCNNESCSKATFVEDFDGFLSYYGRMTERCADFICMLAMETSCEGCARICRAMNLQISGDSVIRLLIKRYRLQPVSECGSAIGVDDFAFKKRHTYGTIIVDQATHRPVAILDGRDGMTLKEWLKNNKHVKTVTRDRASAYSSAIQEILPDAMQIADRFHLHQNLLEAGFLKIMEQGKHLQLPRSLVKKMHCDVDKPLDYNEKSVQLYHAIHEYSEAGYSKLAISKMLHCSRNTVTKYLEGDYDSLCRKNFYSGMDQFYDYVIKELSSGVSRKDVFRNLIQKGYKGGQTAAYDYMNKIIERFQIDIAVYRSSSADAVQKKKKLQKYDHISRNGIFRFLWMNHEITDRHKSYLMDTYPQLRTLMSCIREFREIFQKKNMPCLYLFIEKYKNSDLKELSRFASGLEKDLSAVENAVASPLSNGFVEGTNSKLKMIKRTMYGRCSKELLAAKLILSNG